jgi:hypothetical protein
VARYDERERVLTKRAPHGARGAAIAQPGRHLAVRERRAGRNGAGHLVDAAVELRHAVHVDYDRGEIARLAVQEGDDTVDGLLHLGRRRALLRAREPPEDATARPGLATRLRELHADDAAIPPRDPASADRRLEERVD